VLASHGMHGTFYINSGNIEAPDNPYYMRTIWQLDQVEVSDGGPDDLASTPDNSLFAVQGLFVP
jgi:hypothetical protein